jgi:hypothetical protein
MSSMLFLIAIMQIYFGVVLMKSVFGIRRFFVERGATDFINTGMLIRHSLAFGIYLASFVIYYVTFAVYTFNPFNP